MTEIDPFAHAPEVLAKLAEFEKRTTADAKAREKVNAAITKLAETPTTELSEQQITKFRGYGVDLFKCDQSDVKRMQEEYEFRSGPLRVDLRRINEHAIGQIEVARQEARTKLLAAELPDLGSGLPGAITEIAMTGHPLAIAARVRHADAQNSIDGNELQCKHIMTELDAAEKRLEARKSKLLAFI